LTSTYLLAFLVVANCSLWENCHANKKSEAIACARRFWSSWLTGRRPRKE
jgi:hypothetical protein